MKAVKAALLGLALAGVVTAASAQNEQFIPMNGYWVGPYAPGGSGIFGGFIDYINMLNARTRLKARMRRGIDRKIFRQLDQKGIPAT